MEIITELSHEEFFEASISFAFIGSPQRSLNHVLNALHNVGVGGRQAIEAESRGQVPWLIPIPRVESRNLSPRLCSMRPVGAIS